MKRMSLFQGAFTAAVVETEQCLSVRPRNIFLSVEVCVSSFFLRRLEDRWSRCDNI